MTDLSTKDAIGKTVKNILFGPAGDIRALVFTDGTALVVGGTGNMGCEMVFGDMRPEAEIVRW
jgi:hypothetical protein